MSLEQAMNSAFKQFGYGIVDDGRLMNILSDYQAFERPMLKTAMKELIESGYASKIMGLGKKRKSFFSFFTDLYSIDKPSEQVLKDNLKLFVSQFSEKCSYKSQVRYIIDCLLFGLGWIDKVSSKAEADPSELSKHKAPIIKKDSNPVVLSVNPVSNTSPLKAHTDNMVVDEWASEYVVFKVSPSDAKLVIDGKQTLFPKDGNAFAELNYGQHTVYATASLHNDKKINFNVERGKKQTVSIDLQQDFGTLVIKCKDPNAKMFIDNKPVASMVNLSPGGHRLDIKSVDYLPFTKNVHVIRGEVNYVAVEMRPNTRRVEIVCPTDGIDISVDGKSSMTSTRISGNIIAGNFVRLHPGKHMLTFSKPGFQSLSKSIFVQLDEKDTPMIVNVPNLVQNHGGIKVNVMPFGQKVIIDGVEVGDTPYKSTNIPVGNHVIVVEGDMVRTYRVTVVEGEFRIINNNTVI